MNRVTLFMTSLVLVVPALSHAQNVVTKTDPKAKVSVDFPGSWKIGADKESLIAVDPKDEVMFTFTTVEAADMKRAAAELDKMIEKSVTKAEWEPVKQFEQRGMHGALRVGKGMHDKESVHMLVVVLNTPTKKAVIALGFIDSAKRKDHEGEVKSILDSIRPAADAGWK